ncbi:hypothetical protein [Roseateles chitinivorans]|uniref:hypothetical protein n=1 Tax=Roseateles chitinivorans TaxID=2917965 RepID=UPI003D67E314
MKAINYSLFLLGAMLLAACGNPPRMIAPRQESSSTERVVALPEIGAKAKAEVGANMFEQYRERTTVYTRAVLLDAARAKMDMNQTLNIPAGAQTLIARTYDLENFEAACFSRGSSGLTGSYDVCLVDQDRDGVFDSATFSQRKKFFPLEAPVRFNRETVNDRKIELPDFKYVVLYQGISRGTIKVSFREFKNDLARPAFTQDVFYDLNTDGTGVIAFKGARIAVDEATSTNITYRVLKPFD